MKYQQPYSRFLINTLLFYWIIVYCNVSVASTDYFDQDTRLSTSNDLSLSTKQKNRLGLLVSRHHYSQPKHHMVTEKLKAAQSHQAINQYLQSLDPYSSYLSIEQLRFKQKRQSNPRIGLGLNFLIQKQRILAVPALRSPALKAKFTVASYLDSLNNKRIDYDDFASYAFLADLVKGQTIDLQVSRMNQVAEYRLSVESFRPVLWDYQTVGDNALLTIREFKREMIKTMRHYLLKAKHKKRLIIDLRHCPGGNLYATVDVLSLFLAPKQSVAFIKKAHDNKQEALSLETLRGQINKEQTIDLLISPFTASAAEVFVRAIKHYRPHNSRLIGTEMANKCLAQTAYPLSDGSALHLSTYQILTPDQYLCHHANLSLDVALKGIETLSFQDIDNIVDF